MSDEEESTKEEAEKKPEEPKPDALKDTDTLPSETKQPDETKEAPAEPSNDKPKRKKIIGLMGIKHDEGPPGSTHG